MKVFALTTAAGAAGALMTLDGADASSQSWHVKVHVHTKKVPMWGTCYTKDGGFQDCEDSLECIRLGEFYGQCLKKYPVLWDQCGGNSFDKGSWKRECVPNADHKNSTCSMQSPEYYQCVDPHRKQHYYFKDHSNKHNDGTHHHHHHHKGAETDVKAVGEWGQCKWKDNQVECAPEYQCITENDYYGKCMKKKVKVWEQCGGKAWKQPWTAECTDGSTCVKKDEWYSQCLFGQPTTAPSPDTASPAAPGSGPTTGGGVTKWGQCGGANYHGPTSCVAKTQCIKHSNWYSQCKPDQLPVGELCAEAKKDNTWSHPYCEGGAKCDYSNADKSESRCKN
jgi:hypothetical protein